MKHSLLSFFLAQAILLPACRVATATYPDSEWIRAEPENLGVSKSALAEALGYLKSKSFDDGINELIIIKDGAIIYEGDSTLRYIIYILVPKYLRVPCWGF